ncbi:metallophosphoesterase, partial [Campylobacter jejuni CVM 41908]
MLYAPTYCLFFMTLAWDFIKLILALMGKRDKKYNLILRLIFEFSLIVLSVFLIYISINNALKTPEVKSVDVEIPNLKQDLKIAMLTDIHLGKNLHENFLDKLITKVNLQSPDMVV